MKDDVDRLCDPSDATEKPKQSKQIFAFEECLKSKAWSTSRRHGAKLELRCAISQADSVAQS